MAHYFYIKSRDHQSFSRTHFINVAIFKLIEHKTLLFPNFIHKKAKNVIKLTFFDERTKTINDCNGQCNCYHKKYIEHNQCSHKTGMLLLFAMAIKMKREISRAKRQTKNT